MSNARPKLASELRQSFGKSDFADDTNAGALDQLPEGRILIKTHIEN